MAIIFKKEERCQMNNLTLHLKELEKEEQTKLKASRKKKIIKIRAEINKIENRKFNGKNNNNRKITMILRANFFKKINKMDKLLAN